jgi:hypothetical protein
VTHDAGAADAIGDTGPVLRPQEIARAGAPGDFRRPAVPVLVAAELRGSGVDLDRVTVPGLEFRVVPVAGARWRPPVEVAGAPTIRSADAQVLALARARVPRSPELTDDLASRRRLEAEGAVVVGSVGILVRAPRGLASARGAGRRGRRALLREHPPPQPRLQGLRAPNLVRPPLKPPRVGGTQSRGPTTRHGARHGRGCPLALAWHRDACHARPWRFSPTAGAPGASSSCRPAPRAADDLPPTTSGGPPGGRP